MFLTCFTWWLISWDAWFAIVCTARRRSDEALPQSPNDTRSRGDIQLYALRQAKRCVFFGLWYSTLWWRSWQNPSFDFLSCFRAPEHRRIYFCTVSSLCSSGGMHTRSYLWQGVVQMWPEDVIPTSRICFWDISLPETMHYFLAASVVTCAHEIVLE